MMILLIAVAMLNVPPLPPPPSDQRDAAATLLQAAPIPSALDESFRHRAILSVSYAMSYAFNGHTAKGEAVGAAMTERVTNHLAANTRFAADLQGCVQDAFAYAYDLPTLQSMRQIVATSGGRALWDAALSDPIERCYGKVLPDFLQSTGFAGALRWFARAGPRAPLPPYDPGAAPANLSAALTSYCGRSTRDALVTIGGRLGIRKTWDDAKRNRKSSTCLVAGARLAGHDLPIFDDDGREIIVIM